MSVSAIIPAAGSGKRIGKPKLLLEIGGKSFLKIIYEKISGSGIDNIVCVVDKNYLNMAKEDVPSIEYAVNPNPENGMLSSIYFGIRMLKNCEGILINPVDHPMVELETYKILVNEFKLNKNIIIKPSCEGKSGHPVIVPFPLSGLIMSEVFQEGLSSIILKSGLKQKRVEVKDRNILKNINTKEDLVFD